jgi:hypothetical protein
LKTIIVGAFGAFGAFGVVREWSGNLSQGRDVTVQSVLAQKTYLECGLLEIGRATELHDVTWENLVVRHACLVRSCGGLRSPLHGLESIRRAGIEPFCKQAQALLDVEIEGFAVLQWGRAGGCVTEWLGKALADDLDRAAAKLSKWADALLMFKQSAQQQEG